MRLGDCLCSVDDTILKNLWCADVGGEVTVFIFSKAEKKHHFDVKSLLYS